MSFTSSRLPRSLHAIAAGRAISLLGDEVAIIAIAFRAKTLYGHWGMAAVLIAGALPLVVLAGPAGLLVDRVRTKPLLTVTLVGQGVLCLALARVPGASLLALVALLACGQAVVGPAWQALVSSLVDKDQLPSAFGLMQSAQAAAGVLGPVAGGFLYATMGFVAALTADAITFFVLALVAFFLHADRIPSAHDKTETWRDVTAGIRAIVDNPRLRAIMVLLGTLVLTVGVVNVAEIYFVTTNLGAGAIAYGMLGLAFGAGSLLAGVSSGAVARRFPQAKWVFTTSCAVMCLMMVAFSLVRSMALAVPVVFVIGVANALVNVNVMVMFSSSTPPEIRGRVFSSLQAVFSTCSITAMAIGGVALTWLSPSTLILVGGLASIATGAVTIGPVLRPLPSEVLESANN